MYFSIIFSKQLLEENISQPIKWTIFDSIQIETEITNKFYLRIPVTNYLLAGQLKLSIEKLHLHIGANNTNNRYF